MFEVLLLIKRLTKRIETLESKIKELELEIYG